MIVPLIEIALLIVGAAILIHDLFGMLLRVDRRTLERWPLERR